MATTLKARAGSQLVYTYEYRDADGEIIPTTDSTVRLELKSAHGNGMGIRAVFPVGETSNTWLQEPSPSVWTFTIPGTAIRTFDSTMLWELELVGADDSVITLDHGVIKVEPEIISNT